MSDFPRTTVGGVSVSRMIIGTNWFLGFSHTSVAKDEFIKEQMDRKRVADVMEVFVRYRYSAGCLNRFPPAVKKPICISF